jgi:hypothetical protein
MTKLAYTFGVHFKDGSKYFQTPEDVSERGPEHGSAFSDIKDRLGDIELFQIEGNGQRVLVDLRDGHFEFNGVPMRVGDPSVHIPRDTVRRLVYFRRVTQSLGRDIRCAGHNPDGSPIWEAIGDSRTTTVVEHHVGWQATVAGKNHQVTVALLG